MYRLIVTAKMNDVDPQAWLADVLAASPDIPSSASTTCCLGLGHVQGQPRRSSSLTVAAPETHDSDVTSNTAIPEAKPVKEQAEDAPRESTNPRA